MPGWPLALADPEAFFCRAWPPSGFQSTGSRQRITGHRQNVGEQLLGRPALSSPLVSRPSCFPCDKGRGADVYGL